MSRKHLEVSCGVAAALMCGLAVLTLAEASPLRVAAGALLVLALPGYVLQAALYAESGLRAPERGVLSVGLSVILCILGGLTLERLLPDGLTTTAWVGGLVGVTCAAGVGVVLRAPPQSTGTHIWARLSPVPPRVWLSFGASALLCACAFAVVAYGVANEPQTGFTQMWLAPAGDVATRAVQVGIRNQERVQTTYTVRLEADGRAVGLWNTLELAPGEDWQTTVVLPGDAAAAASVTAALFRAADADAGPPYRHAQVWLSPS